MKIAKFTVSVLMISLVMFFTSCEDDIERTTTHTDNVSAMIVGTYTGSIQLDSTASYDNVTITLTKFEDESVDAVFISIQSSSFTYNGAASLNLPAFINSDKQVVYDPAYLNVAVANDGYVFSSVISASARLNGRINGNDLFMQVPILVYGTETIFHTNGDDWEFYGTKK